MPDASIRIDGRQIADQVRYGQAGGVPVANLVVAAGRSKKNDQGGYDQLSSTPYDIACWNEVHDLLAAQSPEKGSQVRITGTVTGVRTYQDQQGQTQASVEVRAEGVKVFPKRQQSGGYGQQPQAQGYGQQAPQQGYGGPAQQGGYDDTPPPF